MYYLVKNKSVISSCNNRRRRNSTFSFRESEYLPNEHEYMGQIDMPYKSDEESIKTNI